MDEVTWAALTLSLTAVGALYTWLAFRRRGLAAGLRGTAYTLLPVAAFLTDTMRMFTRIGGAVADWALGLVLSPVVWAGVAVFGAAVVLYVVSGFLLRRQEAAGREVRAGREPAAELGRPAPGPGAPVDEDLDDIEALLKRRGIT